MDGEQLVNCNSHGHSDRGKKCRHDDTHLVGNCCCVQPFSIIIIPGCEDRSWSCEMRQS